MKNSSLTQLDTNQIIQATFDEKQDAQRVILVGGEKLDIKVDSNKIAEAIKDSLKNITVPSHNDWPLTNNFMPVEIERNVFIPQIQKIEIPTIIKEIEYKTVEIPVIVEKIVYIDKPVFIKEIEFKEIYKEKEFPLWHKICTMVQTIVVIGLLLSHFIK